jgi:hypothetical protein
MRIAAGSLLRVLENFRVADGSIIIYQTCSALITLGHMPRGYLARISHREKTGLEAISKIQIAFKDKPSRDG